MNLNQLIERIHDRPNWAGFSNDSEKILCEIFIFEYYLLQLQDLVKTEEEIEKINLAEKKIKSMLETLYMNLKTITNNRSEVIFDIEQIKANHKKNCRYYLSIGIEKRVIEVVEVSLAAGAKVFINDLKYAVEDAIEKRSYDIVEYLLNTKPDVNEEILITKGILFEENDPNREKDTLLNIAVRGYDLEMLKRLRDAGANVNLHASCRGTPLSEAILHNAPLEIIQFLLSIEGINVDAKICYFRTKPTTALYEAIHLKNGCDPQIIQALLKAGASKNEDDFFEVISLGLTDVVQVMVTFGYQCSAETLVRAIDCANAKIINLIKENTKSDEIERARKILKEDGYISYLEYGYTDLIFYVAINDIKVVRELLNDNVDINIPSHRHNETPLNIALKLGHVDIARMLINAGADINIANHYGETPLMRASHLGCLDVVESLLIKDVDVNKMTALYVGPVSGKTALMFATIAEHTEVVKKLLSHDKIDLLAKGENRKSAFDLANESQNEEIKKAYAPKVEAIKRSNQLQLAKPLILIIRDQIEQQIRDFKGQGKSLFNIGNNRKAGRLQEALNRACSSEDANLSTKNFLTHKSDGKESIIEVCASHRMGFFGRPTSQDEVENLVNTLCRSYGLISE